MRHGSSRTMSCSRRSTARNCCLDRSGGTWALYFTSLPAAQFSWPQILDEGLFRFDRWAGRGDDPHLHQKSGDGGQAVGPVATKARVLIESRLLSQNPS